VSVSVDEHGVQRALADGTIEALRWEDLRSVLIVTTSEGPLADDVAFVLVGEGGHGVAVPDAAMPPALLDRLLALPGFDHARMIEAMGSTQEAQFLVWQLA
jgi:hypothetical protein